MSALPSSLAPSGHIGQTAMATESRAPASSQSETPSIQNAPLDPMAPTGESAAQAESAVNAKWQAEVLPSIAPQGDVIVQKRGKDGKFVGRAENPNATKPGEDYARPANDDDAGTSVTAGAEPRTAPASATEPEETETSWDESFAKTFGVPKERAREAAKLVSDDFGRVMSDFDAGKYRSQQGQAEGGTASAEPSRPSAGQPQGATPPQASEAGATVPGVDRYSEAEIKAYYDSFDADTAKAMESQARRHNALFDLVAKSNQSNQQAQQLIESERQRVRAEEQAKTQARYYQTEIAPFFADVGARFPRLAKTFGTGANATSAQREMQGAVLRAAGTYQEIKARDGSKVTDRQALEAAVRNLFADEFEKEQKATERREVNIRGRHANRDIGAGPGGGGRPFAGKTLLDVSESYLKGGSATRR